MEPVGHARTPRVYSLPHASWVRLEREGCQGVEVRVLLSLEVVHLALLRFEPDATIDEHAADHPVDVICLEGEGMTSVDGVPASLTEGEGVFWPAGVSHRLWTEGSTMMTLMVEHIDAVPSPLHHPPHADE